MTQFVTIDTNEGDQNALQYVSKGNRILIGAFDKQQAVENYFRSNNHQAMQWLDRDYSPRKGVKPGAGQIRVESRLGFFHSSDMIRKQLEGIIKGMHGVESANARNSGSIHVYLFCTTAGGTGSGSFISASYLIKKIIEEMGLQSKIIGHFLLSTLITDKVAPELHDDIHANSYAALKELESLVKLDYDTMNRLGMGSTELYFERKHGVDHSSVVDSSPFFLSFIYDSPSHLHTEKSAQAIADTAFMQTMSPVIVSMDSELDNYEKLLTELTTLPGEMKDVSIGYAKNYGACGAAALVLPGTDLLEYCTHRFAAEAIRSQITFGVDKNQASDDDDRAKALAKLAVDYSDKKFMSMSEDAREAVINRSFVDSVKELARRDEKEEVEGGFWQHLVEQTESGVIKSYDAETGEALRDESYVDNIYKTTSGFRGSDHE